MPPVPLLILLACVIAAAALTVWLLSGLGPTALLLALPAALIAALALRKLPK